MNARTPHPDRATSSTVAGTRYPLALPDRMSLETVARRADLHPELVQRFIALGLLDTARDASGRVWFTPDDVITLARIQRLRAGLALNYAAIGLVLDLLRRLERLELARRDSVVPVRRDTGSEPTWT